MNAAAGGGQEIPAQVLLRTLSGISGMRAQIAALERRYSERQDLPGVRLMLRVSSMLLEAMQSQWVKRSREIAKESYPGPDQPLQRERAERGRHQIPLDARLKSIVDGLRRFETLLGERLELLAEPHGSAFDALSEPFRRLAKELPGDEEVELIFRPTTATNYEIWFRVIDDIRLFGATSFGEELNRAFSEMPRLMAIEYPSHYEGDVFLHAVIAHEIGHIAFFNKGRGDQAWLKASREAGLTTDEQARWRPWYVEFGSDLLATRMIGPAYPLALVEHTIGQNNWFNPSATSGSHPPIPTRLLKLNPEISSFFDGEAQVGSHRLAMDASEAVVGEWMAKLPPVDPGLPPEIDGVFDAALSQIDATVLEDAEFPPRMFQRQLGPVWDALSAGIAPAEIVFERDREREESPSVAPSSEWSEPCDWRSILNGCYLRWLHDRSGGEGTNLLREGMAAVEDRLQRCEHARGAIELSELHRAMLLQKDQLQGMELASA